MPFGIKVVVNCIGFQEPVSTICIVQKPLSKPDRFEDLCQPDQAMSPRLFLFIICKCNGLAMATILSHIDFLQMLPLSWSPSRLDGASQPAKDVGSPQLTQFPSFSQMTSTNTERNCRELTKSSPMVTTKMWPGWGEVSIYFELYFLEKEKGKGTSFCVASYMHQSTAESERAFYQSQASFSPTARDTGATFLESWVHRRKIRFSSAL